MANRYVSPRFNSGEEFEEFLAGLEEENKALETKCKSLEGKANASLQIVSFNASTGELVTKSAN